MNRRDAVPDGKLTTAWRQSTAFAAPGGEWYITPMTEIGQVQQWAM
jgi:hypothetical protein